MCITVGNVLSHNSRAGHMAWAFIALAVLEGLGVKQCKVKKNERGNQTLICSIG